QSYQNPLLEFGLAYKSAYILKIYQKDSRLLEKLTEAYHAPSIDDGCILALHKPGFTIEQDVLDRNVKANYAAKQSVKQACKKVYENVEVYWELYELAEKLVDIEDLFQQWRFRHMKTVERIIGFKAGTGGSGGVSYLKKVLDYYFFPELWELRTDL